MSGNKRAIWKKNKMEVDCHIQSGPIKFLHYWWSQVVTAQSFLLG